MSHGHATKSEKTQLNLKVEYTLRVIPFLAPESVSQI